MTLSWAANFRYSLLKLRHAVAEVTSSASPNISLASAIQSTLEAYKARLTTVIAFTGASMAPTLNPDASSNPSAVERLLVRQIGRPSAKNIFVGDMVALHSPLAPVASAQNVLVRRVAAMEGDEMVSDDPETVPFSLPEVCVGVADVGKELASRSAECCSVHSGAGGEQCAAKKRLPSGPPIKHRRGFPKIITLLSVPIGAGDVLGIGRQQGAPAAGCD